MNGLGKGLAGVEPFDIMIDTLESFPTGVIADIHPDEPISSMSGHMVKF